MNYDIFAWPQSDVLGINPKITIHKLFADSDHPSICQKKKEVCPKTVEGHRGRGGQAHQGWHH